MAKAGSGDGEGLSHKPVVRYMTWRNHRLRTFCQYFFKNIICIVSLICQHKRRVLPVKKIQCLFVIRLFTASQHEP